MTVGYLSNHFLHAKNALVKSGELGRRTWADYKAICDKIIAHFGRNRLVAGLRPDDFAAFRAKLADGRGLVTLGNAITRARVVFKHAHDACLIDRPVPFGKSFCKPDKAKLRGERQAKGPRMFSAPDIRAMLATAKPALGAMLLLGINCGFGNTDCARLPLDALDLEGEWVNYPRPKTHISRRCPLWPETVAAIKAALEVRPNHKAPDLAGRVFITKYGNSWEAMTRASTKGNRSVSDPIASEMRNLLLELKIHRKGLGFYALRHTFQTIAQKTRDKDAVREIMGHTPPASDMSAVYNEQPVSDDRLLAVTGFVREWLFSSTKEPEKNCVPAEAVRPAQPTAAG